MPNLFIIIIISSAQPVAMVFVFVWRLHKSPLRPCSAYFCLPFSPNPFPAAVARPPLDFWISILLSAVRGCATIVGVVAIRSRFGEIDFGIDIVRCGGHSYSFSRGMSMASRASFGTCLLRAFQSMLMKVANAVRHDVMSSQCIIHLRHCLHQPRLPLRHSLSSVR